MSGIKSFGTEDPEYYAELLCETPARPLSDEPCHYFPGTQDVDRRIQKLLDAVADISLCQRGNVSATMACLQDDNGTLETLLYTVFNHEDDQAVRRCPQHLQDIFDMLRQVPYKPLEMDGSKKVIAHELEDDFIEICKVTHDYSFDIFAHRVTKHEHKLSVIRGYIEQDQTHFTLQDRSVLVEFLDDVGSIITAVAYAQNTKRLSTIRIKMLLAMYSYWTEHGLLPEDPLADNKPTLLDKADKWLADAYGIDFQLRHWALKIMSLLISANRLFVLTQSHRLRKVTQGKFLVQVLTSPTTAPYRCDLSAETVQKALDAALAETEYLGADLAEKRGSFIEQFLRKGQNVASVDRRNPTVHAELAMIMAMVNGEIHHVLPYIGISKFSCIMCSHYIRAFNEVTRREIVTKGSNGKAYPGWFWPSLPNLDGELRPAFLKRIKQQLVSDFERHAGRRFSASSAGSGGLRLGWNIGRTRDELDELKRRAARVIQLGTVDTGG